MKTSNIKELERLLELKFQKKQIGYSRIVAEENRLRQQLQKLDEQLRASEASSDHSIRALGADIIWKKWVERAQRRLTLDLAHVLAQKETLRNAVKKDYGKLLVSRELLQDCETAEKQVLLRKQLEDSIEGHQRRKPTV